jgi:hypothetical protein
MGNVARIIEEEIELDLVDAVPREGVEPVAVGRNEARIGDAVRVLEERRLGLEEVTQCCTIGVGARQYFWMGFQPSLSPST